MINLERTLDFLKVIFYLCVVVVVGSLLIYNPTGINIVPIATAALGIAVHSLKNRQSSTMGYATMGFAGVVGVVALLFGILAFYLQTNVTIPVNSLVTSLALALLFVALYAAFDEPEREERLSSIF